MICPKCKISTHSLLPRRNICWRCAEAEDTRWALICGFLGLGFLGLVFSLLVFLSA